MIDNIRVIAFDADDTLWVNEPYFRDTEEQFASLLEDFLPRHSIVAELYQTEIANLPLYGYGIKGFMLSMIETVLRITQGKADAEIINRVITLGQEMLNKPIELLDGVEDVLKALHGKYRLVVATKGDLLDQERKLKNSGLDHYFHHIEIMSDKQEKDYEKLLKHLDCPAEAFLMLGNSLKSDVLPVLNIGGHAVHIPYHTTWVHEHIDHTIEHPNFYELKRLAEVLPQLIV
ncbi:HAD family hydrolase [Pedobacter rhizosphaerae]|uniref:Putative hydrolase of the HAD superfamily n=1 Tax=Pedobacter rhizosphaerae TaxID=390241 RepID=A0A1H9PUH8_9SPHI|nr:HAD family hydrolase [Pedobacter rhizosphaerae]SER51871.1 putative hydrolase of the HAD superfamily [Pedobacter rhizosphaerae]